MVFEITEAELTQADAYGVEAYVRVKALLASVWQRGSLSTRAARRDRYEPREVVN